MRKLIAAVFITLMFVGSAYAGTDASWQSQQNIELDGNMGPSEC